MLTEITEGIWEIELKILEFDNAQKSLYMGFVSSTMGENVNTDEIFLKHSLTIDGMCNHANKKELGEIKIEKN